MGVSLLDCLLDEEERAPLLETFDGGLFLFYTSSKGFNHMQYQIRDPEGFARMLETIIETGRLPTPGVKKA